MCKILIVLLFAGLLACVARPISAEEAQAPTILGFGGAVTDPGWLDSGGLEELAILARHLAELSRVPTAVLLNEVSTYAQILRGLREGCNAVMLDSSYLPFQQNVAATQRVTAAAHALGATVEAELGHLPDASATEATQSSQTDPLEAAEFVRRTGVDALAISIGNVHLLTEGESVIDLDRLDEIHRHVPVPLVIHGGTGFPISAMEAVIARGVAKFNYGTGLKRACLEGIRAAIATLPPRPNVQQYIGSRGASDVLACGKASVKAEIIRLMRLCGCAGQAKSW